MDLPWLGCNPPSSVTKGPDPTLDCALGAGWSLPKPRPPAGKARSLETQPGAAHEGPRSPPPPTDPPRLQSWALTAAGHGSQLCCQQEPSLLAISTYCHCYWKSWETQSSPAAQSPRQARAHQGWAPTLRRPEPPPSTNSESTWVPVTSGSAGGLGPEPRGPSHPVLLRQFPDGNSQGGWDPRVPRQPVAEGRRARRGCALAITNAFPPHGTRDPHGGTLVA